MIKHVTGDLIALAKEGHFDVIVHGCNCFCTMGAGIARTIAEEFPEAFVVDQNTERGDSSKLGTCTTATNGPLTVVNAYTQYGFAKSNSPAVDYYAIRSCLSWVADNFPDKRIGIPYIGAGLAGGDWSIIRDIIEDTLGDTQTTVVEWGG